MQVFFNQAPHRKTPTGWGVVPGVEMVFSSCLLKKQTELLPRGSWLLKSNPRGSFPQRCGRAPLPNWI